MLIMPDIVHCYNFHYSPEKVNAVELQIIKESPCAVLPFIEMEYRTGAFSDASMP